MEGKRSSGGATLEPAQAPPVQVVARRPSLAALLTHCGQLMVFVHAATIKLGLCKNCNVGLPISALLDSRSAWNRSR